MVNDVKVPVGWGVKRLEELLNRRTEADVPNVNKKVIDLSVMPSDSICLNNFSAGDSFNSNMKKLYMHDILFGSIRPYLHKAGIAPFNGLRAGTVHAFFPKNSNDYTFCAITMTNKNYFEFAVGKSAGSTRMPSVSSDDLLSFTVLYDEQFVKKYQKLFANFAEIISNNINHSHHLATLRDFLLPLLMNGQISVNSITASNKE